MLGSVHRAATPCRQGALPLETLGTSHQLAAGTWFYVAAGVHPATLTRQVFRPVHLSRGPFVVTTPAAPDLSVVRFPSPGKAAGRHSSRRTRCTRSMYQTQCDLQERNGSVPLRRSKPRRVHALLTTSSMRSQRGPTGHTHRKAFSRKSRRQDSNLVLQPQDLQP
jgi:hypothetical protein